jgi:hypothetical protein
MVTITPILGLSNHFCLTLKTKISIRFDIKFNNYGQIVWPLQDTIPDYYHRILQIDTE